MLFRYPVQQMLFIHHTSRTCGCLVDAWSGNDTDNKFKQGRPPAGCSRYDLRYTKPTIFTFAISNSDNAQYILPYASTKYTTTPAVAAQGASASGTTHRWQIVFPGTDLLEWIEDSVVEQPRSIALLPPIT